MKAAVSNLLSMLTLNSNKENSFIFEKDKLVIPLYQREYEWDSDIIQTFLSDINKGSKFLGNIILDEKDDYYELIDGQQRITTCLLTIACIHNCYIKHERTRTTINKLLKNDKGFYLENYSIPNFLELDENNYYTINKKTKDIYNQYPKLENAFQTISEYLKEIISENLSPVMDLLDKLKDCSFLVLINETSDKNQRYSVEELFLDINEKGKKLELEDVFKGHCFKNYDKDNHEELKNKWIEFKKNAMPLIELGYKNVGEYIYTYILAMVKNDIPETLTIKGKHYLQDKTEDETDELLTEITNYANSTVTLYNNLKNTDYDFNDLCPDTCKFTTTHNILRQMCVEMIGAKNKSLYPKLAFFTLVNYLRKDSALRAEIKHDRFFSLVSNYYIYTKLFAIQKVRKNKTNIDQSIKLVLEDNSFETQKDKSKKLIDSVKTLRKDMVKLFIFPLKYSKQDTYFLYSVIDFFDASKSVLKKSYNIIPGATIEHFIYHDNKSFDWKLSTAANEAADPITFEIEDSELYSKAMKSTSNYLCIDENLNNNILKNFDIIEKIRLIKEYFTNNEQSIPYHIEEIINFIENMNEYKDLKSLKDKNITDKKVIQEKYELFITAYFNDYYTQQFSETMHNKFINALIQHT